MLEELRTSLISNLCTKKNCIERRRSLFYTFAHPLQQTRVERIVSIQKQDPVATDSGQCAISGHGDAAIRLMHHTEPFVHSCIGFKNRTKLIWAAIVDTQAFPIRPSLVVHGVQPFSQILLDFVTRHND